MLRLRISISTGLSVDDNPADRLMGKTAEFSMLEIYQKCMEYSLTQGKFLIHFGKKSNPNEEVCQIAIFNSKNSDSIVSRFS